MDLKGLIFHYYYKIIYYVWFENYILKKLIVLSIHGVNPLYTCFGECRGSFWNSKNCHVWIVLCWLFQLLSWLTVLGVMVSSLAGYDSYRVMYLKHRTHLSVSQCQGIFCLFVIRLNIFNAEWRLNTSDLWSPFCRFFFIWSTSKKIVCRWCGSYICRLWRLL